MASGFDRLAKPYRWLEYATLGPALQRCRTCYLTDVAGARQALVLGDGDGRFTEALLAAAVLARVTAVDGSEAMLRELLSRCSGNADRLTTHAAWIPQELAPPILHEQYDLIATHFFLDCLSTADVERTARILHAHATRDCQWLICDFAAHKRVTRLVVTALYRMFRMLTGLQTQTLPDHAAALRNAGWVRIERRDFIGGLLFAERWQRNEAAAERLESYTAL